MALVFVHGIKGGRLRDRSGVRWVGGKQALGLDRRRLALPLTRTDGRQDHDGCTPDGPLDRVLGLAVYGKFLRWAEARWTTFVPFSYDWRRPLTESAERLTETLNAAAMKDGEAPLVVAHSMGGLVTLLALRERPSLASGVVFAGVPFGTGIEFAYDCHHGAPVGLNRTILDPRAHATWSAHWVFFPTDGSGIDGDHDWYDPAAWEDRRLGVYGQEEVDVAPYREHQQLAMPAARELRTTKLEDPGSLAGSGVRIAVLRSRSQPVRVRYGGDETAEGDGRVLWHNTEPPGVEFTAFETRLPHDKLLDDAPVVEAALIHARG